MDLVVIAIVALVVGAAAGAAVVVVSRGRQIVPEPVPDPEVAVLRALVQEQSTHLARLADAEAARRVSDGEVGSTLRQTQAALAELRATDQRRREQEAQVVDLVKRVDTVFGGARAGRAGESVLQEFFESLPPGMLLTNYRVNGKVVEFGLRLPDGRCLPVDSKLSAVAEIEALEASEDPDERARLAQVIEQSVRARVREVAKYLDPSLTAPVAVAAVPDSAYAVLRSAHTDAFNTGVVVVSYSMALPVLLFLHSLVSRYGEAADVDACLAEVESLLESVAVSLENKVTKATTMLQNGSDEIRGYVGKAKGSIARARAISDEPASVAPEPELALRAVE